MGETEGSGLKERNYGEILNLWLITKKSSKIRMKIGIFSEKVKSGKFSTESEKFFGNRGKF